MKYFGKVGFVVTEEQTPGKWMENVIERKYTGDILRASRRYDGATNGSNVTGKITDEISIMSDNYMQTHLGEIRYIHFGGSRWDIASISTSDMPRIKFTLGGIYNGPET